MQDSVDYRYFFLLLLLLFFLHGVYEEIQEIGTNLEVKVILYVTQSQLCNKSYSE